MDLISVIVPVYKVEKYLDRCVESLVNQVYTNIEIILVDDGSPDGCPQKCDDWAKKDQRILVVHKTNGGLGDARNAGLEFATGEWIAFVDSDDYIKINTYQICMNRLRETNADICYFGLNTVSVDGKEEKHEFFFPETLEQDEIRNQLLPKCFGRYVDDIYDFGTAWMGIYRRQLLEQENIRFVSERDLISEDYVYTVDVCARAERITFVNDCLYCYCMNEMSLSHSYRSDRFEKIVEFYENRIEKIQELHLGQEAIMRANVRYWELVIGCLKQEINSKEISIKRKMLRIREICVHKTSKKLFDDTVLVHMNAKQQLLLKIMKNRMYIMVFGLIRYKRR